MRRVIITLNEKETDALMCILLNAAPSAEVCEPVAEALLCRVAEAQRSFARTRTTAVGSRNLRRVSRRRKAVAGG